MPQAKRDMALTTCKGKEIEKWPKDWVENIYDRVLFWEDFLATEGESKCPLTKYFIQTYKFKIALGSDGREDIKDVTGPK